MSIPNTGQTTRELNDFFRSDDNKLQLLSINQGTDNIKEIYLLNKNSLSNTIEYFFQKLTKGLDNRLVNTDVFNFENQDSSIKDPAPAGLVAYLTKGQLTELEGDPIIKPILDGAGKFVIDSNLNNKIIKNLKYETIGQVYNTPRFNKTNPFTLTNDTNILDDLP